MGARREAPVMAILGWVTRYREPADWCSHLSPITQLIWSCTRGAKAVSGQAPQCFPGALFNALCLSITFLKPLVPPLSAGFLMLEIKHFIYLPAVGRVSTRAAGTGVEIPTPAPFASTNPCLSLNPQLWPKCEAETSGGSQK